MNQYAKNAMDRYFKDLKLAVLVVLVTSGVFFCERFQSSSGLSAFAGLQVGFPHSMIQRL